MKPTPPISPLEEGYGYGRFDMVINIYYPTVAHVHSYLFGIICGYLIYRNKTNKPWIMSKLMLYISWAIFLFSIFTYFYMCDGLFRKKTTPMFNAVYNSTVPFFWSLFVCWFIYICSTSNCDWLNDLFSNRYAKVLSRLTFSMYITHPFVYKYLYMNMPQPVYFDMGTEHCTTAISEILSNFTLTWQVLDALGKPPSGIGLRNYKMYGSFEICYNLRFEKNSKNENFGFKYCQFVIDDNQSLNFPKYGACLPEKCVNYIENHSKKMTFLNKKVIFDCLPNLEIGGYEGFTFVHILLIILFALIMTLQSISSINDLYCRYFEKKQNKIVNALSIISNMESLFDTSDRTDTPQIHCLHGLRTIGKYGIIYGHYLLDYIWIAPNENSMLPFTTKPYVLLYYSNFYQVDTFFVMSGFLVSYTLFRYLAKFGSYKKINWKLYYIGRFVKLLPMYYASLLFLAYFLYKMYDGVEFVMYNFYQRMINYTLWKNFLLIQNIIQPENSLAARWLWYISADLHMYLVAPFFIVILYRKPKYGVILYSIIAMFIIFYTGILTYTRQFPIFINHSIRDSLKSFDMMNTIYFPTWFHFHSYLIGILCAYVVYNNKYKKIQFTSKATNKIIWTILIILISIIAFYSNNALYEEQSLQFKTIYNAIMPFVWSSSVSWIIYSCATNNCNIYLLWIMFSQHVCIDNCNSLNSISNQQFIQHQSQSNEIVN
ncbi:hypothetical protein A3Q56_00404 [Intoshia linei]|uniref:Uncharacterized protein n=1 Tax=Intoshia linei TaxID=1819745 RepID=A0A177BC67_9BILA|nr:hypothetical protein A3Q56_00404 [Intoshia linei]